MTSAITAAIILSIIFTSGGCASALVRAPGAWTGESPSTEAKIAAGAADIATAPIQAPLMAVAGIGELRRKAKAARMEEQLAAIRQNPAYIFEKRLHVSDYDSGLAAVWAALGDPTIPFTDGDLRRLYLEMGWSRVNVLSNARCSIEFLREVWTPIRESKQVAPLEVVDQLVRNPSLPSSWLEEIAADRPKYGPRSGMASSILKSRQEPNKTLEPTPTAVTPPAAQEPRQP